MKTIKVLTLFGTRPEATKMCPVVKALANTPGIESVVCTTGQHREILQNVLDLFKVKPDYPLDVMREGQSLSELTARILTETRNVLQKEKPDLALVHGDTTTTFSAALSAFYEHIPVGHVEAGLRTESIASPFPEELNRRLTARIAALHFAPTEKNARNLQREGVTENVFVTGNTAIDALRYTVEESYRFTEEKLNRLDFSGRVVTVTAHRRENWGKPLENICKALLALSDMHPDIRFVFPMHPNRIVRDTVVPLLSENPRFLLIDPLDTRAMHNLLKRSYLVLSDSGGLQEEAPALGVPVVVLREETEREDAVESGTVVLSGTSVDRIIDCAERLLSDTDARRRMIEAISPYGDGYASERIVGHIAAYFAGRGAG